RGPRRARRPRRVRPAQPGVGAGAGPVVRTAIVTGASRGIGAATARALNAVGIRVALVGRHADSLAEVAASLDHDPLVIVADLAEADAADTVANAALDAFGAVDVLVNNAADAMRLPTASTDAATIDRMLAVNVRSP